MRRHHPRNRQTRTGIQHIGEILPAVLAQYSQTRAEQPAGAANSKQRETTKPTQRVFTFAK